MYSWPQNGQNGKKRIFLDTTLTLNDSQQLSKVSGQVLDKSDVRIRSVQKPDFLAKNGQKWQKLAIFGQNLENDNFFQKSAWNIFLDSSRCSFVQKIIAIWCAVF